VVSGHEDVGHLDAGDHVADLGLDGVAERGEVSGVEHGLDAEALGQPASDLGAERVRVDVAHVQDPKLGPCVVPGLGAGAGGVEIGDLGAEHPHPISHLSELLHVAPGRGQDRRGSLHRSLVARSVEGVDVELPPREPAEGPDGEDSGTRPDQRVPPPSPGQEHPSHRAGENGHQ